MIIYNKEPESTLGIRSMFRYVTLLNDKKNPAQCKGCAGKYWQKVTTLSLHDNLLADHCFIVDPPLVCIVELNKDAVPINVFIRE